MELQHGCRSEYGPLELRIQSGASLNGFTIFVEDPRPEHPAVYEHVAQSSLESAKENAVLEADRYLKSREEESCHTAEWRCS
jgi:hypothetical protein